MTKYFLHMCDGVEILDREGGDFSNAAAAMDAAQTLVNKISAKMTDKRRWHVAVRDESGVSHGEVFAEISTKPGMDVTD